MVRAGVGDDGFAARVFCCGKSGDKADRLIVEFNSRLLPGIPWQMLGNEGAALLSGDGSAAHISALALEGQC